MDDLDAFPIKENGVSTHLKGDRDAMLIRRTTAHKRQIADWSREELEDKYLRIYDENLVLKVHVRKQEDKIKRMATKLLRLVSDKKKEDPGVSKKDKWAGRDIETEVLLEDMHARIKQLESQNQKLKSKLSVKNQQVESVHKMNSAYDHVPARINTGITKSGSNLSPRSSSIRKQMRVTGPLPGGIRGQHSSSFSQRHGHTALDKARQDNQRLEQQIDAMNEQISIYVQELEMLKEQMQLREAEYDEDLLKVKQQVTQGQRTNIQENIDIIKLQREVKEKSTKMTQLQAMYANMEDKLRTVKNSHDSLLIEMETINEQLKAEQSRVIQLQNELKSGSSSQRTIIELQERCADVERECEILKEANEKLVASAFDLEREREWKQREGQLKVQIAQLEATLKADVGEKGSILDVLNAERDQKDKAEEELKDMRLKYFKTKQDNDELRDKMKFFTNESSTDIQEVEEALLLVKKRKEKENQNLNFLLKVDEEKSKDSEKVIRELQAEHADTINELEKTRNLLIMQHKINKDYQQEVEAVTNKMEELRKEYETKLDEYAALLDIRANRIKKLERQLRDVAYGTRQYRIQPIDGDDDNASDIDDGMDGETIELERGENLFEIHIKKVSLTSEALHELGDQEPQVFGTWEFYEHEVHATPVMRGPKADFDFTSQYVVKVDDFFLHYLQKDSCTFELHQSFGTDYRTVAAGQLKMRDILDRPQGRLHNTLTLVGMLNGHEGTTYGNLEYWVRLKVPMEQALRLFKERTKALGYIDSNVHMAQQALTALDEDAARRPPDNVNQLTVKLLRCNNVQPRREGIQPSPYIVYKLFDYADHATSTVPGSNNPQFNDHQVYNIPMTVDLDTYLKTQSLKVYVFDDTDPEPTQYLGCAKIPLIHLAHDKPIKGHFELFKPDGSPNGTVDVSMKWKFNYIPPKAGTRTAAQMRAAGTEAAEDVPLLPGEEDALKESVRSGAPGAVAHMSSGPVNARTRGKDRVGPTAASTPASKTRQQPEKEDWVQQNVSVIQEPITATKTAVQNAQRPTSAKQRTLSQVSDVSEGSPVPGEDETLSDVSEDSSTPRGGRSPPQSVQHMHDDQTAENLIAAELGETSKSVPMSDTMFGDAKDHDSVEERESARSRITNPTTSDTDSDIVCVSPNSREASQRISMNPGDQVVISINSLSLDEGSTIIFNEEVNKLFVEYRFLGVAAEETECPYALPKPGPGKEISFNFTKIFAVDFDNYYERRQYLASMLLPNDPEEGKIRFTIVSEPDDEDGECEDVGRAYVNIRQILDRNRDINEERIEIYDVNDESEVIGQLNVTIKCLEALKAVQMEMTSNTTSVAS